MVVNNYIPRITFILYNENRTFGIFILDKLEKMLKNGTNR